MTGTVGTAPATDDKVAATVATVAGRILMDIRATITGRDPKALRDEGDRRSHDFIVARLAQLRPNDPVLSEEGAHDGDRLGSSRVWIVDPLDGTREFGEPPRDDWAVHVALCVDGTPTASAVALPAQGITMSSGDPTTVSGEVPEHPRLLVSRTRPPEMVQEIARAIDGELVPMGSAGAKAMAVVQGRADAYIHAGGQYEWDNAAPAGVCVAAGLHVSRVDGSAITYNQENPWLPDILICRKELADRLLGLLRDVAS